MKNNSVKLKTFKFLIVIFSFSFLIFNSTPVAAQVLGNWDFLNGIVPCGRCAQFSIGSDGRAICVQPSEGATSEQAQPCTICHFFVLIQNIINFLLYVFASLATLMAVYIAFLFMFSGGSPAKITEAKEKLWLLVIGIFWVLGSWLVLNTILNFIVNKSVFPWPWNQIRCEVSRPSIPFTATKIQGGTESHIDDGDVGVFRAPTLGVPSSDTQKLKEYTSKMNSSNSSILIDKSDKKMYIYYFGDNPNGELIAALPINTGLGDPNSVKTGGYNGDKITPVGEFTITSDKRIDTVGGVYNQQGVNLGSAFLGISAKDENGNYRGIGIHGNSAGTLGSTMGCVRVKNADLPVMYAALEPGTKIKIRN